MHVADHRLAENHGSGHRRAERAERDHQRVARRDQHGQRVPHAVEPLRPAPRRFHFRHRNMREARQHRQHAQVRRHQHRNADRRRQRQLADHRHRNGRDGHEGQHRKHQRHRPRLQQALETQAGGFFRAMPPRRPAAHWTARSAPRGSRRSPGSGTGSAPKSGRCRSRGW